MNVFVRCARLSTGIAKTRPCACSEERATPIGPWGRGVADGLLRCAGIGAKERAAARQGLYLLRYRDVRLAMKHHEPRPHAQ